MFLSETHSPQLLAAESYVTNEQFEAEKRVLLEPAWHCVGSQSDLPNVGDFLTLMILGRPVLVRRGAGGIRAFLNVCSHRFCLLTDQARGNSARMKCQYHGCLGYLPHFARVGIAKMLMKHYCKYETVHCQLTSISDILKDHSIDYVDYLKVDAEGAEIEILEAVSEENWLRVKQIVVETHRGDEAMNHVQQILRNQGFETYTGYSQSSPADKMVYGFRETPGTNPMSSPSINA